MGKKLIDCITMMNAAYAHPEKVPWYDRRTPIELMALIGDDIIRPCRALDMACGLGFHSIYLAQHGFQVTGVDCAKNAIKEARKNADDSKVKIDFRTGLARDVKHLKGPFGFVLEWGLLHFVMPEEREAYIHDLAHKMTAGAYYMVLTFNENSPEWDGPGAKYRQSPKTCAPLYYSSKEELDRLYAPYFDVVEYKLRPTYFPNNGLTHLENFYLLRRKELDYVDHC